MLIDSSYFIGERNIPNTEQAATSSLLDTFIRKYENDYLRKSLGYELFKAFSEGIADVSPDQRFLDLLFGKEFTDYRGKLNKWNGLVSVTTEGPTIQVDLLSQSDLFFTVGTPGAPANGDASYVNTGLAGVNYRVYQRAYGPLEWLKEDESNSDTADIQIDAEGGFTWLNGIKFNGSDKFNIIFISVPFDVSTVEKVPLAESPIADYVYCHWLKYNATQTTGIGEKKSKAQNADDDSPVHKMVQAWNDMVNKTRLLFEFLEENAAAYPEYDMHAYCKELATLKNRYQ